MMLDHDTKRRIDSARDILVGKVPDPKSQVEQITIALIYKFMDDMDGMSESMGGKRGFFTGAFEKYGWNRLVRSGLGGHETLNLYADAVSQMPENPSIPRLFTEIFKNAYLPYRDPETLRQFLRIIDQFDYGRDYERLGDAFEHLLSIMGSQGDAGQFRTPRHIIDFIVGIVDPRKDETVLDPACGTAGFLISAYKHILDAARNEHGHPDLSPYELEALVRNIRGYDISPDMVRLSLVNLYLHKFRDPRIAEYDTLTSDDRWDERANVILANPPFMTERGGIRPHSRFGVRSKRSEVLFVDYIMQHLTGSGRAGLVVPEGIIFQSQNAHRSLRENLVDNYLAAVVSLPAGVFNPYSGVKTSILILDRAVARISDTVGFFRVDSDGFDLGAQRRPVDSDDLPEVQSQICEYLDRLRSGRSLDDFEPSLGLVVSKDKIRQDPDFNLSMERYRESVQRVSHYPFIRLGEIAKITSGNSAPQGSKFFDEGEYPFVRTSDVGKVHRSDCFTGSADKINQIAIDELRMKLMPKNTILFPESGASSFLDHRVVLGEDAYVSSHLACIICDDSKALPKFVFRVLCNVSSKSLTADQAYPSIRLKDIADIQIPLPPLSVQREIVAEISGYQSVIDGAMQVVRSYKPHIHVDPEWEVVEFDSVCTLEYGASLRKQDRIEGPYPVMGSNGVSGWHNEYLIEGPAIIVGRKGWAGEVTYVESNCFPIDTTYYVKIADPQSTDIIFLDHVLKGMNLRDLRGGAGIPGLNRNDVYFKHKIPLPPLDVQRALVAEIQAEQELVDGSRSLVARMESKVRAAVGRIWEG